MSKGWEFLHKWCAMDDDHEVRFNVRHSNLCVYMSMMVGGEILGSGFALTEAELRQAEEDVLLYCAQLNAQKLMRMRRGAA